MKPHVEPKEEDCCHSGCNPCIFDVYQGHLEKLKKQNEYTELLNTENGISEIEYTPFYVMDIEQLCNSQKVLKFKRINNENAMQIWWNPGDHFLLKYISNKLSSFTRAYTPIKLKGHGNEDFDFLIVLKKYKEGLVSNYLFNLEVGAVTLWRGPYGSYEMEANKYDRIFMIAQGTGIAPFMSIIGSILNNEDDLTKLILYFCCRNIDEVLFRNELYEFNSYWNFSYKIFLSSNFQQMNIKLKYEEPIAMKKFNIKELENMKPCYKDQFLLCGSDCFMKEYENILKNENFSENIILF